MVFSSTGDTTRTPADSRQSATAVRFGRFATSGLVRSAASEVTKLTGLFSVVFPSDCRLCGSPLTNISRLPVCHGCWVAIVARTLKNSSDPLPVDPAVPAEANA
jgi:hypothetical protein